MEVPLSAEGLFPAVGMHSMGEEVKVDLQARWLLEEDESIMMVDSHEEDWGRLHDIRASGMVGVGPVGPPPTAGPRWGQYSPLLYLNSGDTVGIESSRIFP